MKENSMIIKLSQFASSDILIKNLIQRAKAVDFLVEVLKQGEQARVALDKMFYEKFGWVCGSATSMLGWFEQYGWVKPEVRAEEKILIDVDEEGLNVRVKINKDGTVIVGRHYSDKTYTVIDPVIETGTFGEIHVTGKREIQVKRKYYKWVA